MFTGVQMSCPRCPDSLQAHLIREIDHFRAVERARAEMEYFCRVRCIRIIRLCFCLSNGSLNARRKHTGQNDIWFFAWKDWLF